MIQLLFIKLFSAVPVVEEVKSEEKVEDAVAEVTEKLEELKVEESTSEKVEETKVEEKSSEESIKEKEATPVTEE